MGDEPRFSEKWDFRRKENSFNDSSSDDDPDSNSTQDPIIHNSNLILDSNQIGDGTKTVTTEVPVKTRKRRSKKDETKPEKPKQVRKRKAKTACADETTVCAEETTKKEETVMGIDGVGMFMETLLHDLTASRESLMDWMKTELSGSSDQDVVSRPPLRKQGVSAVAAQRPVKKRMTKKKKEEEEKKNKEEEEKKKKEESEKQSKPDEGGPEMNTAKEKSLAIAQNGGDLDCNAGPLDMFLVGGQGGLGGNYFQQQQGVQEALVTQTEMKNSKNETVKSQKSIVLAIKAPNLCKNQKKTSEANTNKNTPSMVERTGPEAEKDHSFVTPFAPNLSSSPSLQSFPVPSSLFSKLSSSSLLQSFPLPSSLFPSSSQGITSLASNSNFQLRQPVAQIPEFQTGETGLQGFGNSLFNNNGYFSGFPSAFQPNLIAGGYNFPAQVNPATSQQRDDNNMFGDLRMAGGAIRFSGNRFPEAEVGISNDALSNYRASSDIDKNACSRDKSNNYLYVPY